MDESPYPQDRDDIDEALELHIVEKDDIFPEPEFLILIDPEDLDDIHGTGLYITEEGQCLVCKDCKTQTPVDYIVQFHGSLLN